MKPETWWLRYIDMNRDFQQMLYIATITFPDNEYENYAYLAEALWAEDEKL